jgi:deoxyribodipyrimidine photo-lyase
VILHAVTSLNANIVYSYKEICSEEKSIDEGVRKSIGNLAAFDQIYGNTLYDANDFNLKSFPQVFTQFRKTVESSKTIHLKEPLDAPKVLKPCPVLTDSPDPELLPLSKVRATGVNAGQGASPSLESLGAHDLSTHFSAIGMACPSGFSAETGFSTTTMDARSSIPFEVSETAAMKRLNEYFWGTNAIKEYKITRNGLLGPSYSSKFSIFLALGNISSRRIVSELKKYEASKGGNESTYWLIFELLWRDFFKFASIGWGTKMFFKYGPQGKSPSNSSKLWRKEAHLVSAWAAGRTGYPFVDANMRELLRTGFMSNRGRQNVASFLVNDLELDWRIGAAWFESLLVDHDPSSNYGNWNYVAGVGSDPRENRYFLITKQATSYDPDATYMRAWIPEIPTTIAASALVDPRKLPISLRKTYPGMVKDLLAWRNPRMKT